MYFSALTTRYFLSIIRYGAQFVSIKETISVNHPKLLLLTRFTILGSRFLTKLTVNTVIIQRDFYFLKTGDNKSLMNIHRDEEQLSWKGSLR